MSMYVLFYFSCLSPRPSLLCWCEILLPGSTYGRPTSTDTAAAAATAAATAAAKSLLRQKQQEIRCSLVRRGHRGLKELLLCVPELLFLFSRLNSIFSAYLRYISNTSSSSSSSSSNSSSSCCCCCCCQSSSGGRSLSCGMRLEAAVYERPMDCLCCCCCWCCSSSRS